MTDHYAHVAALMTVITDPAAHKSRLDELIAQENAAKEQIARLDEMAADTRRQNSAAQAQTIVLTNRKTALDTREAEIGERAKQLDLGAAEQKRIAQEAAKKLQQREADLVRREVAVEAREKRVADMEAETKAALEKANATRDKLQRHAAAVSAAMQ